MSIIGSGLGNALGGVGAGVAGLTQGYIDQEAKQSLIQQQQAGQQALLNKQQAGQQALLSQQQTGAMSLADHQAQIETDRAKFIDQLKKQSELDPERRAAQVEDAGAIARATESAKSKTLNAGDTLAQDGKIVLTAPGLTAAQASLQAERERTAAAKDAAISSATKPFEVTGADGTPVLVQMDKQGNLTPVSGFGPKAGSSKPLTESQSKALLFGARMQESDKILNTMGAKGVDTPSLIKQGVEAIPGIGGIAGRVANSFVASDDQQSVEQAQRDFVNAVLRRESGAAISPSEFDSAQKQYFPSVGDSEQVKKQKADNRALAVRGMLAEVPSGQRGAISAPTATTTNAWKVTRISD